MPIDIPDAEELLRRTNALQAGLDYLKDKAVDRAPALTGRLRASARTHTLSATVGTVTFNTVYAPKQERRGWQKHLHGGQAHFLAATFVEDADEAIRRVGERLFQG